MQNLLLKSELVEAVENQTFIKNGSLSSCEGIKYDFRLSNRVLRPEIQRAIDIDVSNIDAQSILFINPGEAVYVMTEEELDMPANMFCQLSLKRKMSHEGIIVLGGFIIDPKYKGRLIFGLYNISSERYPLKPGRKLVAGVFTKIAEEDVEHDAKSPEPIYDFPEKLEDWVKRFKPLSTESLSDDLANCRNEISELKAVIKTLSDKIEKDDTWRQSFKDGLDELQAKIDQIADNLSKEVETRTTENNKIRTSLSVLKGIGIVIGGLLGGGLVSLVVMFIAGILKIG